MDNDLISRSALLKELNEYNEFAVFDCEAVKDLIDNAPTAESENVANHLRDRIKDIDHEIMIPQSDESKCFLDGKRKAFQYVLDLLEAKGGKE